MDLNLTIFLKWYNKHKSQIYIRIQSESWIKSHFKVPDRRSGKTVNWTWNFHYLRHKYVGGTNKNCRFLIKLESKHFCKFCNLETSCGLKEI